MLHKFSEFYRANFFWILIFTFCLLLGLSWINRFVLDDAFISFRYAENFARGWGLVWNAGERVEGYTNFLWTLLMTLPHFWHLDPVPFSYVLGILFFFCSLIFTYKLSLHIFTSRNLALLTTVLLGTNYTFSSFATGGLETSLQACTFAGAMYLLFRLIDAPVWTIFNLILLSLLLSAALLTRLDSALMVIMVLAAGFYALAKKPFTRRQKLVKGAALILPLLVLVGGWLGWKWFYYGDILPNTFYVKVSFLVSPLFGLSYLGFFFLSYWLFPFIILFFLAIKKLLVKDHWRLLILMSLMLLWSFYLIMLGGDFMEFRFLVPILPFGFILLTWLIFVYLQLKRIRIYLVLLIFLGSAFHAYISEKFSFIGFMETKPQLANHITQESHNLEGIGKALGKALDYDPEVVMATRAAGAIPYYSKLRTIDMLGLNDKWVARHGEIYKPYPGHTKITPLSYLIEKRVNLLIAHPYLVNRNLTQWKIPSREFRIMRPEDVPPESKIVAVPVSRNYQLIAVYLFPHPKIEEAIKNKGWKIYPLYLSPS